MAETIREIVYIVVISSVVGALLLFIVIDLILIYRKNQMHMKARMELDNLKFERSLSKQRKRLQKDLTMAVERDRERLANDVHDQLGSNMSSIKIYFQGIKKLVDSNNEKLQSNLSKIDSAIERSTGEIRKISKNIVSGILAEFGLPAAIQDLADTIRQGGYECNLDIQTFEHRFSRDIEINLFRIAQELSTNSIRHSGGSVIEIGLKHDKGKLVLTYRDNGVGYEKSAVNKGMGLNNLLSRSEQIDGFFSDDTEKDIGVSYLFSIPLDKNQSK